MGQMYPRKPFAGFARPLDPDSVLRSVRTPTLPPPREAEEVTTVTASADSASTPISSAIGNFGEELSALADRLGSSLKENTLTTLGSTLAIGIAFGAIFGSKIGRISLLIAAGALLHNFAIPEGLAATKDVARRSGA